jgi:hypothetical protein
LEHPHHITGPDRKQALQGAKDVFHYFASLPIWPQKKDGGSALLTEPPEGTKRRNQCNT